MTELTTKDLPDIWDILVTECGARDDLFREFQATWPRCVEFRFSGNLGFGGKVWANKGRVYVTCYREDETPERLTAIEIANKRLRELLGD